MKLRAGLPSLRRLPQANVVMAAIEGSASREGFRICEYTVQIDHLHLMVEADSRQALGRGMAALKVSLARRFNRLFRRRGPVAKERFHHRVLRTPREVRNALAYLLHNCHKHCDEQPGPDPVSSGWQFEGWDHALALHPRTLPRPLTWLLSTGWLQHWGPIPTLDPPWFTPRRPSRT